MSELSFSLPELGWSHFFQQQLSLEEWESTKPARVLAVHRNAIDVASEHGAQMITLPGQWHLRDPEELPTVGDWLLLDPSSGQPQRMLERKSLIRRKAAGIESKVQLMAANVDTLFVVTSCNQDFNSSRLERYLALALESKVDPVVVLTKADLADDVSAYQQQAIGLNPDIAVETVNALDSSSVASLLTWCACGQTVALVGSSGVGKSTLINTLCGVSRQETGTIRDDDAKGRHTTTSRTLHSLPSGGLLIDNPGLRELQLSDCQSGVSSLFEDIEELAQSCRFNDCLHQSEEGCAVKAAIAWGDLSPRRLTNYQKLMAEQQRNSETIAEKRRRERNFGKHVRSVMVARYKERDGY
ncbi:MAG: ribosome small subunit-dependent GTPase A [Desulfuromonas sp.]|nr:MAG: ribosome small subunit-dependent GTPase A [Desulfuromonas sp.]